MRLEQLHDVARHALADAIAAGLEAGDIEARVDPDRGAEALAGAIFYARLLTSEPMDEGAVDDLIATVLGPSACGARSAADRGPDGR